METGHQNPEQGKPKAIWFVAAWSISRSIVPILAMIGFARIQSIFGATTGNGYLLSGFFHLASYPQMIGWALQAIVFGLSTIGILLAKSWGRSAFLLGSIAVFVWNMRVLLPNEISDTLNKSLPFFSFTALVLGFWILNIPVVRKYFRLSQFKWQIPHIRSR